MKLNGMTGCHRPVSWHTEELLSFFPCLERLNRVDWISGFSGMNALLCPCKRREIGLTLVI